MLLCHEITQELLISSNAFRKPTVNEMNYVSQNRTLIILSTKCLLSNALRESEANKINYASRNRT